MTPPVADLLLAGGALEPITQTRRQIYLPGGGGGGPVSHGGSFELSIRDFLGTQRITIQEANATPVDLSSVSFSSPDTIGAQTDLIQLVYRDFETNALQTDQNAFTARLQESIAGMTEAIVLRLSSPESNATLGEIHSLRLNVQETLASSTELHLLSAILQEANGALSETAQSLSFTSPEPLGAQLEERQFTVRQQETNATPTESLTTIARLEEQPLAAQTEAFLASVTYTSQDANATPSEVNRLTVVRGESNGALSESLEQMTVTLFANAVLAQNVTDPNNAVDTNVSTTYAYLQIASSGVAGISSNSVAGSITVGFPDFTIPAGWTLSTARLFHYSQGVKIANALAGPSGSINFEYSKNAGGAYTNLGGYSGNTTGAGLYWSNMPNAGGNDVLPITQTEINNFQVRANINATSGTGNGSAVRVEFYGTTLQLVLTRP